MVVGIFGLIVRQTEHRGGPTALPNSGLVEYCESLGNCRGAGGLPSCHIYSQNTPLQWHGSRLLHLDMGTNTLALVRRQRPCWVGRVLARRGHLTRRGRRNSSRTHLLYHCWPMVGRRRIALPVRPSLGWSAVGNKNDGSILDRISRAVGIIANARCPHLPVDAEFAHANQIAETRCERGRAFSPRDEALAG